MWWIFCSFCGWWGWVCHIVGGVPKTKNSKTPNSCQLPTGNSKQGQAGTGNPAQKNQNQQHGLEYVLVMAVLVGVSSCSRHLNHHNPRCASPQADSDPLQPFCDNRCSQVVSKPFFNHKTLIVTYALRGIATLMVETKLALASQPKQDKMRLF